MTDVPLADVDSDADVVRASLTQPPQFGQLFDRHYATVRRYAASRLGAADADDAAGDTFLEAFRIRSRWRSDPGESALPWLLGIATNVIHRRRDAERRWLRNGNAAPPDRSSHDEAVDAVENRIAAAAMAEPLANALARLRTRDRDTLMLHVATGLDMTGLVRALGVPVGTVKSRLNRARRLLAAHLQDHR